MQVLQLHRAAIIGLGLSLLFAVISCHEKDETIEVVGFVKHSDFTKSKIKTSQTFSGYHVTIGCRSSDGKIKTMGSSKLNEEERFNVLLPRETAENGVIREECYAQLHTASNSPCPLDHTQEALNIIFQYKTNDKNTITHSEKLNFSPITCTSKFLWPFFKPKWPPIIYPPPFFTLDNPLPPSVSTPEAAPTFMDPPAPFLPKHGDFSPPPVPTFDAPASPFPLHHVPSVTIPQPPPIPTYKKTSTSPGS